MMRTLGNGYGVLGFGNLGALGISLGPHPMRTIIRVANSHIWTDETFIGPNRHISNQAATREIVDALRR